MSLALQIHLGTVGLSLWGETDGFGKYGFKAPREVHGWGCSLQVSQEVVKLLRYQLRKEHMAGRSPGQTPGEDSQVTE